MTVLDRYFLRRWLRPVLATLTVCLLLFLLAELFGLMDHLIDQTPPVGTVGAYLFYRVTYLLYFLFPLALLIGGYWFLHGLRQRNEWSVVLTSGVSPLRLLRVPLVGLVLLWMAAVIYGVAVIPNAGERMERLREQGIKGKTEEPRRFRNVHLRLRDGRIITIGLLDPEEERIENVRLTRKRNNRIVERWDARVGRYDPGAGWILRDVVERRFTEAGQVDRREVSRRRLQLSPPGVLGTVLRNDPRRRDLHPSRYGMGDLFTAVRFRDQRGMNTLSERVYLHWKFGFPLVLPLLGLGGFLMGLYSPLGRTGGIGVSLLGGFGYWILYNTVLAMGQSPALQARPALRTYGPLIAVYGPPLVGLTALGVFWYRRVR